MRARLGTVGVVIWGFAVNLALQKGWLDWLSNWAIGTMFIIPIAIWIYVGVTHDRLRGYLHHGKRAALLIIVLVLGLVGGLTLGVVYSLVGRSTSTLTTEAPTINGSVEPPAEGPPNQFAESQPSAPVTPAKSRLSSIPVGTELTDDIDFEAWVYEAPYPEGTKANGITWNERHIVGKFETTNRTSTISKLELAIE